MHRGRQRFMNRTRGLTALLFCVAGAALPGIYSWAQGVTNNVAAIIQTRPLPNGIELSGNGVTVRVTALRDDVLRVRAAKNGEFSEDASWAVLNGPRMSSVSVTAEKTGFSTKALRVSFDSEMRLTVSDLVGRVLQQDERPIEFHGASSRLYKTMAPDEHFFGLGDKVGPLDRRNQAFTDWNTDSYGYQESTDPIYKSIPFFLSWNQGRVLGVFFDNTWRSSFDFGKEFASAYSFGAPDGPADYYLLYGPSPKQVVEDYAWLTGPTPIPPLWSLGYQQSRYSYYPEARVREIANRLRADKIPADAIYLDIDYQQDNRPFTVNRERFPTFEQMVKDLARQNLHVIAITDLHIAKLPNAGYAPYDSGLAGDHFVKNPDGSTYVGKVWPGDSVFPDFTRGQTRAWWGSLYKSFVDDGISGFWNDMNEPAIFAVPSKTMPDDIQHRIDEPGFSKRAASHLEIHNIYGMQNSRATYDGLRALRPDVRPFVLTRASYAGGQRYAATWTGDNSSTWNHLRLTTPMLENLGLSGFAMSGADVGGFAGSPQPELLTKWLEIAAFQPIDRDHTAKDTNDQEPWVNGPEQEAIRMHYIEERYKLMPYLYTTAEEMSRTGLPIVRPLFLEFPEAAEDRHPIDLDAPAEFLFGPDILVAPAPYPDEFDKYEVQLPPGVWFDYWTGERIDRTAAVKSKDAEQGKGAPTPPAGAPVKPLMIEPRVDLLPLYVRGGSILPVAPLTQSTTEQPEGPLILRVYVGENCKGTLYQDDGKSYHFKDGKFLRMDSTCEVEQNRLHVIVGPHMGSYPSWWSTISVEVYGWQRRDGKAELAGKPVKAKWNSATHCWQATVADSGNGLEITFE
jgi:alpha-glucosidase